MTSDQRPERPKRAFLTHEGPLFFAHRGGSALAPENTLTSFAKGLSYGADALELDAHPTRDGEIVVFHDDTLDRTTDGSGRISGFTLDDLRQFDVGYRFTSDAGATYPYRGQGVTIPTLAEVYERFPTARVNIEIKEDVPGVEKQLWHVIQGRRAEDRSLVGGFLARSALTLPRGQPGSRRHVGKHARDTLVRSRRLCARHTAIASGLRRLAGPRDVSRRPSRHADDGARGASNGSRRPCLDGG